VSWVPGAVHGSFGKVSEDQAIYDIEHGSYRYFVNVNGRSTDVEVVQGRRRKFLKTKADSYVPNNLLSLPHCS
jgi:hypothetical protein